MGAVNIERELVEWFRREGAPICDEPFCDPLIAIGRKTMTTAQFSEGLNNDLLELRTTINLHRLAEATADWVRP